MWADPESGSQIEFDSFVHLARTAERGLFDFFFLAEGLRLREHRGRIHDLDVVGRPDTFTVLAALAAVTDRLGLAGTINTTFNEPFEVARQFATLDHLSDGRAGWNMVTSSDAFTGENFRRGGFLDHSDRYKRAEEFITVAREFWDSWAPDARARRPRHRDLRRPHPDSQVEHNGAQFDVRGVATLPPAPQGHPVLLQAGDSGRRSGVRRQARRRVVHAALGPGGRPEVLRRRQGPCGGRTAEIRTSSRCFPRRRSCSATPRRKPPTRRVTSGCSRSARRPRSRCSSRCGNATFRRTTRTAHCPTSNRPTTRPSRRAGSATATRRPSPPHGGERAEAENLSIRELVIAVTSRQQFVGTPAQVADEIDLHVQADACDGFILVPHLTPHGLDDFVDRVVPLLQERGSFRTEYTGHTLREHLGL